MDGKRRAELEAWAGAVLNKSEQKYRRVVEKNKAGIPYTTDAEGNYDNMAAVPEDWRDDNGISWWTNGFWGGIVWHLYQSDKNPKWLEIARHNERLLDRCFKIFYGLHHDVGFMYMPTAVADYKLTGDEDARRRGLLAANLLAGRFNLEGRFIRAWNDNSVNDNRGWAIIDCMMNIPLLFWASEETGDPRYRQIAMAHADTVADVFIRENGSSHHIVEFNPETGEVVKAHGGQGYAEGSAWTRGQAWALYGFTVNYELCGKPLYLETAMRSADYFASQIPESGLIPVDFAQPAAPAVEDSCGAAIAACGFLRLAGLLANKDVKKAELYYESGVKLLQALDAKRADYGETCDAILSHCTAAYHSPQSHHISMVYADYFYLEGLTELAGVKRERVIPW